MLGDKAWHTVSILVHVGSPVLDVGKLRVLWHVDFTSLELRGSV